MTAVYVESSLLMKPNIHPDYHDITMVMSNGDTFQTRSTYGKEGDKLLLDVDYRNHPAWTGGVSQINQKASKVASFNKRFAGLGAISGIKAEEAPSVSKEDNA